MQYEYSMNKSWMPPDKPIYFRKISDFVSETER
jgi:hypothetical protein